MTNEYPQALTIAGSDSDGSAGMQADLHTFFARQVYGTSVITACVAGNSYGIHASVAMPSDFIDQEFTDLATDYHIRAADFGPLVVDPVIMTKHGNQLLEESAFTTLRQELLPLATVLTPNFYEVQKIAEMSIHSDQDMMVAAKKMQKMGAKNIVAKGSHNQTNQTTVRDYILLETGEDFWLSEPYHPTDRVNGTGDSLSACITAELAKGTPMKRAIEIAKQFVNTAIGQPIEVGHKFGPINHWAAQKRNF
ncbi:hydroxymethylpyrimidine/phosphomethylpyrimidine kinase [Levilactobacillus brevis]|uniref:hydroxymethylpyrimidine/phosphomethylpyrimidine kinase n=1 Tax=Levilactobacillus brevis TaxID=1580 RepID=UPI000BE79A6A|nr:hydroxymethylpyrimidine/phosphomethylpyrimidine kinase [Levilactobacillus brevis]MCZ2119903.1 hydroxymethylpyrimidine/phosphomethylpyrimidine kinase [Levilactobacillus brevis]MCZ2125391.1 hydroxymethylpyrimidine/phosphomethylpyrimidine kinase [Levilactobacillus brevis]MCZ2209711.1 hydroxymethylpyrimidine/phosphomethylpyrimidine kinase [Levilactobacillus brevis]MCZ2325182.1 hydroxymethylpyrimidine/phosphomethylpyrimidine kinase [Levilactobacillus brevis]